MDIRKIRKLIELMEETDISEIEIKEGEESLRLSRHSNASLESPILQMPAPRQVIHHAVGSSQTNPPTEDSKVFNCLKQVMI